jgi:hypothetical protein
MYQYIGFIQVVGIPDAGSGWHHDPWTQASAGKTDHVMARPARSSTVTPETTGYKMIRALHIIYYYIILSHVIILKYNTYKIIKL